MPPASSQPEDPPDADLVSSQSPNADAITLSFYTELRAAASGMLTAERAGHTLQPTALVNEACLRLMRHGLPQLPRERRLAMAARVLRQVLIDHARSRAALKRRPNLVLDVTETLCEPGPVDFDHINNAIEKLRRLDERQAEVITLRVFGGLSMEQIAVVLDYSKRTIEGDWAVARAWLRRELASLDRGEKP